MYLLGFYVANKNAVQYYMYQREYISQHAHLGGVKQLPKGLKVPGGGVTCSWGCMWLVPQGGGFPCNVLHPPHVKTITDRCKYITLAENSFAACEQITERPHSSPFHKQLCS